MNKIEVKMLNLFLFVFLVVTLISPVIASDVAYIYRKDFRIDQNIINTFQEMGLSVDLINEKSLPKDFSQYKLIFVGDENYLKHKNIPIDKKPSIVANYYNADDFGLTDREGVSQLGSTNPLSVLINGHMSQVYTQAFSKNRITIPYYYLDKKNKASAVFQIAGTETTASGTKIGDVIGYVNASSTLVNGKKASSNICFFGIIESNFWTPSAKNLFKECIGFVAAQCFKNSDCPAQETSQNFCKSGDIYKNITSYSCNSPGTVFALCEPSTAEVLVESCNFGCSNGSCLPGIHDVSLINITSSEGKLRLEHTNGTDITDNIISCNEQYKVTIKVKNNGEFTEDISYIGSIGSINFNHISNTLAPGADSTKSKTTPSINLQEGFYNLTVEAIIQNDSSLGDNIAIEQVFVSCPLITCSSNEQCNDNNQTTEDICNLPGTSNSFCTNNPIACSTNSDCGTDGFINQPFCTEKNITQSFIEYTCLNPGTAQSQCSSSTENKTKQICSQSCSNGECISIACFQNSECSDSNPLTFDECINPGTISSQCRNTPINCASNLDCGTDGFTGSEFCSANNIAKNRVTHTCQNPGTLNSACISQTTPQQISQCQFSCSQGQCIRCSTNSQCNDNNSTTLDICNSPGTSNSFCTNIEPINQPIACSTNSDCGTTEVISQNFCTNNNVKKLIKEFSCNSPGTPQSFCSTSIKQQLVESCSQLCSDGQCFNIECFNNQDCNDNNSTTLDICNSPGTSNSFCTNNPIEITCSSNSDCGTAGLLGSPFCTDKNVSRLFRDFTCNFPGTIISSCSSSIFPKILEVCSQSCSNGQCITQSICGNGILESPEQCDDGNLINGDGCSSQCHITTQCSDGIDNDGDGKIDLSDSGCESSDDDDESDPQQNISISCTSKPACSIGEVEVIQLSSATNAHSAKPGNGYPYSVCCSSPESKLTDSCTAINSETVIKLSATTNAHVSIPSDNSYPIKSCLTSEISQVKCSYKNGCSQDETCLFSISSETNAHTGVCGEYEKSVCCSIL